MPIWSPLCRISSTPSVRRRTSLRSRRTASKWPRSAVLIRPDGRDGTAGASTSMLDWLILTAAATLCYSRRVPCNFCEIRPPVQRLSDCSPLVMKTKGRQIHDITLRGGKMTTYCPTPKILTKMWTPTARFTQQILLGPLFRIPQTLQKLIVIWVISRL